MTTGNRYASTFKDVKIEKVIENVTRPIVEIWYGISTRSINWFVCLVPGLFLNVLVLLQVDRAIFAMIGLSFLPPTGSTAYFIYESALSSIGFFGWGVWQSLLYARVSRRLTEVFQTSGLKNAIGKFPNFVFDRPIDQYTRRLRLTRANLPLSQFTGAKEALESALQIFIDEIKENREAGTVDIVYASLAIPSEVKFPKAWNIGKDSFIVGETRARQIIFNFDETPHLLIGGQSGGGKSTFLRQMITTLYLNNKSFKFYLIDLKGGLEFQTFENLDRVTVVPHVSTALDYLARLEDTLKSRMELLKSANCKDIAAFLELPHEERRQHERKVNFHGTMSRTITVIDEAAELFMAGEKSQASNVQKAKSLAIKIAAQGRAVGLHLVIATQRPDVRAVDGQIKANLPGALSFQMPNYASSMTILDNTRAAHLPKTPGRAVWKSGLEMVELQTPFLDIAAANLLLEPYRLKTKEALNEGL